MYVCVKFYYDILSMRWHKNVYIRVYVQSRAKCPNNMCTCSLTLVRLIYYKFCKETKINKLAYSLKIHIDFLFQCASGASHGFWDLKQNPLPVPMRAIFRGRPCTVTLWYAPNIYWSAINKLFRLLLSYIQQSTQKCLHGSLKYFSRDIFHDFKYLYRTPQVQPLS